jgi:hypothetical protein
MRGRKIRMDPWMRAMRRGDFSAAWKVSDRVLRRRLRDGASQHDRPRHLQCLWDGRPLAGKRVLVHCYHGLGDTLQFVRLVPLLRQQARHVTLWTQPQLLELLHGMPGIDRLAPLHDGAPDIARDADIELMELSHFLRLREQDIPPAPYLRVDRREPLLATPARRVGIAWCSGDWDASRSIDDALLAPLAGVPNVRWHSLQYGAHALPLPGSDLACRDIREQARRMQSLDLVISVDTMVAHLAGALGVPVWLLLPTPCDWRWMDERADSPWYPRMRIFRQRTSGAWPELIERVRGELLRWARDAASVHTPRRCA